MFQNLFQFQYGTIKRTYCFDFSNSFVLFQFQYGTIKRTANQSTQTIWLRFNSNMVRLKAFAESPKLIQINVSIPIWYD